jgi:hypothetical protein
MLYSAQAAITVALSFVQAAAQMLYTEGVSSFLSIFI